MISVIKIHYLIPTLYLLLINLKESISASSYPPTWLTSPYMQAGSFLLINTTTSPTGNNTTPKGTITFPKSFTSTPNLGYGISRYEGNDGLIQQNFQITRTSLNSSSFSFAVQIYGVTNLWFLQIRYVGIQKTFPHKLISFDNVPINYSQSNLGNFQKSSLTLQYYVNNISFTNQSTIAGSNYTTFTAPLTNHKILLFMTSLFTSSNSDKGGVDLRVRATPTSTNNYTFNCSFGYNGTISRLKFSMIVFDQADVQSSGKYLLVYERIQFTAAGGSYSFPAQFFNNFIIGFTQFTAPNSGASIIFNITNGSTNASVYVAYMGASHSRNISRVPLSRFNYTVFYLKTWQCTQNLTYFNPSTNLCVTCPLTNCITCLNISYCQQCDSQNAWFVNSSSGLCISCGKHGCIECNSIYGICTKCDSTMNYVLNSSNNNCQLCANSTFANPAGTQCLPCTLTNCTTCINLTACKVCNSSMESGIDASTLLCMDCSVTNYFLNNTYCQKCSIPHCTTCLNLTNCSVCDASQEYFLNSTSNKCQLCAVAHCKQCYSPVSCTVCQDGFFTNSGVCQPCFINCIKCLSGSTCQQCDYTLNYILLSNGLGCSQCLGENQFPNVDDTSCQTCNISGCSICSSLTTCQICNDLNNYYLFPDFSCGLCEQKNNLFPVNNSICVQCTLDQCIQCKSLTECLICNESNQYFLNQTTNQCQPCSLQGCLNCSTPSICIECDAEHNYGFDHTNPDYDTCGGCEVSCQCGGYAQPWDSYNQTCQGLCGDGFLKYGEECDDGNNISGDGCSSTCKVERHYLCYDEPSFCILNIYVDGKFVGIERHGCNSLILKISSSYYPQQMVPYIYIENDGVEVTDITQNGSYVDIYASYSRDIAEETLQLGFKPGDNFSIEYSTNPPALYYSVNQCRIYQDIMKNVAVAIEVMGFFVLVLSLLSCKIVGLELFGVLQLSYFALSQHSFLNIYLNQLTSFKIFNGLNVNISKDSSQLPKMYKDMKLSGTFINNFNVMFLLMIVWFLTGVGLYIASMTKKYGKVHKIALFLLKQGFITLVIFNSFNIAFSTGVHIKYVKNTDSLYGLSTFFLIVSLILMIGSVFAIQLFSNNNDDYGEFKNKFKTVWICSLYIPLTMCFRIVLGIYMGIKSQFDQSTLVILSFSVMLLLYITVNLPFINVFQNYRSTLIHSVMLLILLIANYYRTMRKNTPMIIKGRIYTPIILQIILIFLSIIVSGAVIIYEIYIIIYKWKIQQNMKLTKPKFMESSNIKNQSENSMFYLN